MSDHDLGLFIQGAWVGGDRSSRAGPLTLAACRWGPFLEGCFLAHTPEGRVQLEGAGQRLASGLLCFQYGGQGLFAFLAAGIWVLVPACDSDCVKEPMREEMNKRL